MSFACRLLVTRPVTSGPLPGTQLPSGKWEEAPGVPHAETLYDGFADVQDILDKQTRDEMGASANLANGLIFLQKEAFIGAIRPDDHCQITWPDRSVEQALVIEVRRLDASLLVNRLRPKL